MDITRNSFTFFTHDGHTSGDTGEARNARKNDDGDGGQRVPSSSSLPPRRAPAGNRSAWTRMHPDIKEWQAAMLTEARSGQGPRPYKPETARSYANRLNAFVKMFAELHPDKGLDDLMKMSDDEVKDAIDEAVAAYASTKRHYEAADFFNVFKQYREYTESGNAELPVKPYHTVPELEPYPPEPKNSLPTPKDRSPQPTRGASAEIIIDRVSRYLASRWELSELVAQSGLPMADCRNVLECKEVGNMSLRTFSGLASAVGIDIYDLVQIGQGVKLQDLPAAETARGRRSGASSTPVDDFALYQRRVAANLMKYAHVQSKEDVNAGKIAHESGVSIWKVNAIVHGKDDPALRPTLRELWQIAELSLKIPGAQLLAPIDASPDNPVVR